MNTTNIAKYNLKGFVNISIKSLHTKLIEGRKSVAKGVQDGNSPN